MTQAPDGSSETGGLPAAEAPPGQEPVADQAGPKAGRNLKAAIAAGVVLAGAALVSLIIQPWLFIVFAVLIVWLGVVELTRALATGGMRVAKEPILVSLPFVGIAGYNGGASWHAAVIGLLILGIMLFRLLGGVQGYVRDVTASAFVAAYLPLMLGFAVVSLGADNGPARIVTYILLTIGSDIGGYVAGVLFGKHPMAASISPKKSWEGFAGSILFQVVIGVLCFNFLLGGTVWHGVVAGVVMTVTATLGDFVESAMKRDLDLKDMGDMVPGHGGIMDRLDSLIPNAFVSWALFTLFLGA